MYKGTTPTFTFTFSDFDPTSAVAIIVTLSADRKTPIIEKDESELTIDSTSVSLALTQEETLAMPSGNVYAQLNFLMNDGSRCATNIMSVDFSRNLHSEVMTV